MMKIMDYDYADRVLLTTLDILNEKGIAVTRIMLHKFLFFLNSYKMGTGFRFEPYTYGPFSFDLSDKLNLFHALGQIGCNDQRQYAALSHSDDPALKAKIAEGYDQFSQIMENDFSFAALECVGTLMYCVLSLKKSGEKDLDDGRILKEFKGWKGRKYGDGKIQSYLNQIKEHDLIDGVRIQ